MFKPILKTAINTIYFQYENAVICTDNLKTISKIDALNTDYILNYDYDTLPVKEANYQHFTNDMKDVRLRGDNILLAKELFHDEDIILYMYTNWFNKNFLFLFYNYELSEKSKMILDLYGNNFE